MRIRPLAALSTVALATILLAGCSGGSGGESPAPSDSAAGDLCAAAAPSGAASEAVTVDGEVGTASTAVFDFPLEITELQSTEVAKGEGDPVEAGDFVQYALTAFNAETGEQVGSLGYTAGEILPMQISADSPLGQIFGCAAPGSRFAAAFPGTDEAPGQVYVVDFQSIVPTAAWGEEQEPVEGMPTVELAKDGDPTITLPDGDAPTEVQLAPLKVGDGPVVASGDTVLVQYTGVKWSDGTVFDSSWESGSPASFQTTGVVPGFQQALEGATVGSQVLVVIPPAAGYGEGEINDSDLVGETLVFVIDILATQHAAAQ
ncbi:MAG TPA: FKBP-type peptidyl-prolyl cis-trans isomerase [Microbacterium sp.]|uniref:FKBP-type peptidyl-prolyl cis-trans isomerase n=1 Tax=Microbacterium sp. TaxID=51671 RepID=UPI002D0DA284|nr:FKBP-type peptidyl-prolyl cis-trans isomerase [Microbacterium sp.]HWI31446.1 FKBP-type peptidyl-prolyl cis-trans isomerase [Microbacterium sp.]